MYNFFYTLNPQKCFIELRTPFKNQLTTGLLRQSLEMTKYSIYYLALYLCLYHWLLLQFTSLITKILDFANLYNLLLIQIRPTSYICNFAATKNWGTITAYATSTNVNLTLQIFRFLKALWAKWLSKVDLPRCSTESYGSAIINSSLSPWLVKLNNKLIKISCEFIHTES